MQQNDSNRSKCELSTEIYRSRQISNDQLDSVREHLDDCFN